MKELVVDVETTCLRVEPPELNGNPFSRCNELVVSGLFDGKEYELQWEKFSLPREPCLLIGANLKFDLHWLRRYEVDFSRCRVWDVQLAEFLLSGQTEIMPSLNDMAKKYGLGEKLDVVKTEYWDNGIDTDNIPRDILSQYLKQDLSLTWQVYQIQKQLLEEKSLLTLFKLQCYDLLVLEEMEWNGIKYDVELSKKRAEEITKRITEIDTELKKYAGDCPINWNSRDHISCFLYGGTVIDYVRIPTGVYKTGAKIGQQRYKIVEYSYDLPRLVDPLKGSELAKEGYYSTNEDTLKQLKGNKTVKAITNLLLERSKLNKVLGTYYIGIPEQINHMDWEPGIIHGQFNQTVARTGRLSSSAPNQQNFEAGVKQCVITRY